MSIKKFKAAGKFIFAALFVLTAANSFAQNKTKPGSKSAAATSSPKIVNIVNFIRLLEPRDPAITEDVLYQTVVKQVEVMKRYHLGGTFLLQYDALMDKRYQKLLATLPKGTFEIGAWWEIPQPMVENVRALNGAAVTPGTGGPTLASLQATRQKSAKS
jgi:hypothetical protein